MAPMGLPLSFFFKKLVYETILLIVIKYHFGSSLRLNAKFQNQNLGDFRFFGFAQAINSPVGEANGIISPNS
jgi:hypothetical protein